MANSEDDKALEEAKRIMARMVNTPPKPHKTNQRAEKAERSTKKPKNNDPVA